MDPTLVALGAFGSFLQELIHWYHLRHKLDQVRYRRLLGSVRYWIVTTLMIVAAGVLTSIWFEGSMPDVAGGRTAILFGFGAPLIVKKLGALFLHRAPEMLGDSSLSDYFA